MDELKKFADMWCHQDYPAAPFIESELSDVEKYFCVKFPEDYLGQLRSFGLPTPSIALLDEIVDKELDFNDLSQLFQPAEIISSTVGWHAAGMPKSLIAIGCDCGGNLFCFDERDLQGKPVPTAPIYFWDHEFDETEKVASSFPTWIGGYLNMRRQMFYLPKFLRNFIISKL